MKFEDIEFKPRFPEADCEAVKEISLDTYAWMSTSKQAIVTFSNGYGASILFGYMFYSNGIDTYELAVTHDGRITYDTPFTSDVLGYLTQAELMNYLQQIENLPTKENMNTQRFLGILALDTILTLAVLYAPSWVVIYIILPFVALGLLGAFLHMVTSKPVKETWLKPTWFGFYDWGTDIIFLSVTWYMEYYAVFWLYLFMLPFKLLLKREPYHDE